MRAVAGLPLMVVLIGIGGAAMLVPAAHALALRQPAGAVPFLTAAGLVLVLAVLLALATRARPPERPARAQLLSLAGAFTLLPALLALPFHAAVGDTSLFSAWFEMVSCITTTGLTLYEPERLSATLHLWRALVGWLGGLFLWVVAAAILAPMNLGGFEVGSDAPAGAGATVLRGTEAAARLGSVAAGFAPVYAGLTGVLWLLLILAGSDPTPALVHAMATLSTSGISATGGLAGAGTGLAAEAAVAAFLLLALSRAAVPLPGLRGYARRLAADLEVRLGLTLVGGLVLALFLRHWVGAADLGQGEHLAEALRALWGTAFTVLSFLTTAGFVSADWATAQAWSGLGTPGVLLMGLAIVGGGVATTAGGVKLLRVWALYTHSRREIERLVHPASVGGAGDAARRLRRSGAEIAWVFFMLFAASIAVVAGLLALAGLEFEPALVLAVAALSTTGPLAEAGAAEPVAVAALSDAAKAVLIGAMVLGRLETLALIALFNPDFWRG